MSSLKQALCHGLRLSKVYRVTEFNQSAWLKPYIDMNTNFRRAAKNDFEKNFFKLMNNSVFGKMIENVRKRREIKLIVSEERRKKLVSEPNYASCATFSDHLMTIEMRKTRIYMDKPILVRQTILDKSKEHMIWVDELGKGHMSEFVAIAPKVYAYQQIHIDNTLSVDKKARGNNKLVTKKA